MAIVSMIIVVAAMGIRSGILVGVSIPISFLAGFIFLDITGNTLNMMVMIGLVLSFGVAAKSGKLIFCIVTPL